MGGSQCWGHCEQGSGAGVGREEWLEGKLGKREKVLVAV